MLLGDQIKRLRWTVRVKQKGELRNLNKILFWKTESKRPFERPKRRGKFHIRMDLREMAWEDVDWNHLALDRDQW
jgi:hypothetical protein